MDRDNQDAAALRGYGDEEPSSVASPKVNQILGFSLIQDVSILLSANPELFLLAQVRFIKVSWALAGTPFYEVDYWVTRQDVEQEMEIN